MRRLYGALVTLLVISLPVWSQQQAAPTQLTLHDAIQMALKSNLGVRVAHTRVKEADGARKRRFAVLLPHVSGASTANLQNRNLRAFGLSIPGIPTVVGPFSNYDFRVSAHQTLLDRQAYHALKASEDQQQAATLNYQDTRDLVVRQAAGLYLAAESAGAEVEAIKARVNTSEALGELAKDQHSEGLATAVDVLRSQVQLQRDRQNLLVAKDAYETSLLALKRFIGMKPGAPIELADRLEFHKVAIPDVDQALRTSLENRSDYHSLLSQRESLAEQQKAAHARYLPTLSVSGNYGALGRNFGEMPGTGLIQATLSITIFNRDRSGERVELESRMERLDDQIADVQNGIEEELRKAVLDLQSAEQQVSVTEAGVNLAQRELDLAKDRFRNGVTDNIEVITAQSSLQSAQDDHILALALYADARVALVRAEGATEKTYQNYFDEH
jgi:outer membrane protein TolC